MSRKGRLLGVAFALCALICLVATYDYSRGRIASRIGALAQPCSTHIPWRSSTLRALGERRYSRKARTAGVPARPLMTPTLSTIGS